MDSCHRPYGLIWLLLTLWCSSSDWSAAAQSISMQGCPSTCGNLTIPYPFGIGTNCARKGFQLSCNHSSTPPKTFLASSTVEVLNISLLQGQARVLYRRGYDCYGENGASMGKFVVQSWAGDNYPYTFSNTQNRYTAIGCDTLAYISSYNFSEFTSGCVSICDRMENIVNGSCSGIGCCQTSIPKGLKYYYIQLRSYNNHTKVWNFNPCSYAFLVDKDWFTFKVEDVTYNSTYRSTQIRVPLVLDWVAGNESCAEARKDKDRYACLSDHSECYDSTSSAVGYLCNCSSGYEGNPYLSGGCQGVCKNIQGGYTCTCPKGTKGDPKTYGCNGKTRITILILATTLSSLVGTICIICLYGMFEKRKRVQLAQKFYKQNGGTILEKHMSTHSHIRSMLKIFNKGELEKATNKFDEKKILGRGGQGMVYEGTLADNTRIAIKKSLLIDGVGIDSFINEIIILSQLNHKNVVRLLGCCLEVDIPYLVYEFVPNNTLFYHLHEQQLPWETRLRIATDTANALAHLHTKAIFPIYHQDVKSTNILLDNDYIAKVSDFGASKLVPTDKETFNTLVQGTLGYLDPEYLETHQFTDKSDVYSFGVVLIELLTGREPLSYERSEKERCLAQHFKVCMEDNRLSDILDPKLLLVSTSKIMMQMIEVANLASRCLSLKGNERPDMMEVCLELEGLWRSGSHPWVESQVTDETKNLLSEKDLSAQRNNQRMYFSSGTSGHNIDSFSIGVGR